MWEIIDHLNQSGLLFFYHVATSSPFASAIAIFFAEWLPYLLVIIVIAYEFFLYEAEVRRALVKLFTAPVITFVIAEAGKLSIHAPRPFADGLDITPLILVSDPFGSFPSAHAAFFSALAVAVFAIHPRMGKWYFWGAMLIAIARVAIGLHWPIDVIMGVALGCFVAVLTEVGRRMHEKYYS